MTKLNLLLLQLVIACLFSCKNEANKTYAIRDFRKSLQPFLLDIVSKGYVTYYDSLHIKSITDDELRRLGNAENPFLRATAFGEMFDRTPFNHFDVVLNHLDDTAIVAVDNGEFGISFNTVSDYMIQQASWETQQAKDSTVNEVLTKHNYLRSAYTILLQVKPQEKYYSCIKHMATRPRRLDRNEGYELDFDDSEYALYGLARFRKKEDVQVIKNELAEHVWELSDLSFRLMKEFPDNAYMDVLQAYHRRRFYKFSGNRPHGFTGYAADRAGPEDFIEALVVQQNKRSARLLDTMLTYLPKYTRMPDKKNIINEIIEEIWRHPCPAYVQLRAKISLKAKAILKKQISYPFDPVVYPIDTTKRKFRWFSPSLNQPLRGGCMLVGQRRNNQQYLPLLLAVITNNGGGTKK